jgi:nicotinate-nucleotide--dimethylbenzimidazole phosphoribosyltransferase
VTGRGTGIDDETYKRKIGIVRDCLRANGLPDPGMDAPQPASGAYPQPSEALRALAAVGGFEHAAIAGFILGGAAARVPVILDGVIAGAAALVAAALDPAAPDHCVAGHRSAEPGHTAALAHLGLRPLVDLELRLGEGTGGLLAHPMVCAAVRVMHDVATFDAAGVTEKPM